MAEFNRASGMFATHLRGRGARRFSGGNDQRSRDQGNEDERGIPMAPRGYMPPPRSPPPPYQEVVLAVNAEAPFTEDALAARNLGHIRQLQRELCPEIEGRSIEDMDEQASRRHSGWDRWYRRHHMQWKKRYSCLWVFALVLTMGLLVVLIVMLFLSVGLATPPKYSPSNADN